MKRREFLKFVGATLSGAVAGSVIADVRSEQVSTTREPQLGTRANPWPMSTENARFAFDHRAELGIRMEYVSRPISERLNGVPMEVRLRNEGADKWEHFLVTAGF